MEVSTWHACSARFERSVCVRVRWVCGALCDETKLNRVKVKMVSGLVLAAAPYRLVMIRSPQSWNAW